MSFLHFLEDLRTSFLDAIFLVITMLGEETVFLVIALVFVWCVNKREGFYILISGLMGTLIPMGPALAGLASGDIESMARNMQVAFATTVTGLVAAAIGYVTQQVKQRWYLQDMTNLEYLSDIIGK